MVVLRYGDSRCYVRRTLWLSYEGVGRNRVVGLILLDTKWSKASVDTFSGDIVFPVIAQTYIVCQLQNYNLMLPICEVSVSINSFLVPNS